MTAKKLIELPYDKFCRENREKLLKVLALPVPDDSY